MEWRRMDCGDETDERQGEDHVYRKNRMPYQSQTEEVSSTAWSLDHTFTIKPLVPSFSSRLLWEWNEGKSWNCRGENSAFWKHKGWLMSSHIISVMTRRWQTSGHSLGTLPVRKPWLDNTDIETIEGKSFFPLLSQMQCLFLFSMELGCQNRR